MGNSKIESSDGGMIVSTYVLIGILGENFNGDDLLEGGTPVIVELQGK